MKIILLLKLDERDGSHGFPVNPIFSKRESKGDSNLDRFL